MNLYRLRVRTRQGDYNEVTEAENATETARILARRTGIDQQEIAQNLAEENPLNFDPYKQSRRLTNV